MSNILFPGGTLFHADNMEVLRSLPDNSLDSVVTDPPYGIAFMNKKWDYEIPKVELWQEMLRILKPGGHMLVACGTRTQHRMVVNIEDAGFEIRDIVTWIYSSGFPKSLNIGAAVNNIQGSNQWNGFGTALKPAAELFTLARKPLSESTIAANVLRWNTGALNIDQSRIPAEPWTRPNESRGRTFHGKAYDERGNTNSHPKGRFPANVIHDGSHEVVALFPDTRSGANNTRRKEGYFGEHGGLGHAGDIQISYGDAGSAARFFYCAKASPKERNEGLESLEGKPVAWSNQAKAELTRGNTEFSDELKIHNKILIQKNHHATVKPVSLMRYLARLITPPGGTVIDPFAGSGTTGIACIMEGFYFILIEREEEYIPIIEGRIRHWQEKKDKEINEREPTLFDDIEEAV